MNNSKAIEMDAQTFSETNKLVVAIVKQIDPRAWILPLMTGDSVRDTIAPKRHVRVWSERAADAVQKEMVANNFSVSRVGPCHVEVDPFPGFKTPHCGSDREYQSIWDE
jgi:hypothetical protein